MMVLMRQSGSLIWAVFCGGCLYAPAVLIADQPAIAERTSTAGIGYFEKHVRPLLAKHCYSCHSVRSGNREGGLLLDSRLGWQQGGDSGVPIVAGDVDASLLIQAVRYDDLEMPPDAMLPKSAIARLEQWVRIGAPDPRDQASNESDWTNAADPIEGRKHWAFRPLATPIPDRPDDVEWPRSAADTFILNRLEAAELHPSDDADRRALLRRVTIQLTGLPPSQQEIDSFLQDDRPDAYKRVVDRLLGSPHFGERWGRHWLDVARYADSNGLDEDFVFREAWRYRNRMIEMINADVPFDRFLLEQIAGDLLAYDSIEQRDQQRISAGFLVIGPKVLLGVESVERIMHVADEQIETIGRAILGQTLGCARCHDHKFDPVPTADYYALAGILTSTRVLESRHMLNKPRLMEQLIGLGANGDQLDEAYEAFWRNKGPLEDQIKHAKSALEHLRGLEKLANQHSNALVQGTVDESLRLADRIKAQQEFLESLVRRLSNQPEIPPRAMVPTDTDVPADEAIRLAGQWDRRGDVVPRGFLQVLSDAATRIPAGQSGRIELANWLTDTESGAGRLTARVLANRVWYHMMGRGIVRTVDNFGRKGEPPSHPELLEHLASELIRSGWSLKSLVRKIALSRTFTQGSSFDQTAYSMDPDNVLNWRANRRRLDPESLRDAMLSAAGTLDPNPHESSVSDLGDLLAPAAVPNWQPTVEFQIRSVYLPVVRNNLPEIFDVFEFADPHAVTGMRTKKMVATQGLFLLNDKTVVKAAQAAARRVMRSRPDMAGRVDQMYQLILGESATTLEQDEIVAFLEGVRAQLDVETNDLSDADAELRAWSLACQALFASSRFQTLE